MLLGRRSTLGFDIQPLQPTWERRYEPEKTAWAALSIWIDNVNICEHVDTDTQKLEAAVNVPLAPLADWLVAAWPLISLEERPQRFASSEQPHTNLQEWGNAAALNEAAEEQLLIERREWWTRHFLLSALNDCYLPNLALTRNDEALVTEWRQRKQRQGEPNWLRDGGIRLIPWPEASDSAREFVGYVSEWLRREGLGNVYPWVSAADPIRETLADRNRALEFYTARPIAELERVVGPANTDLSTRLGLVQGIDDPAASPLTQALRDLPPDLPTEIQQPLDQLRNDIGRGQSPDLEKLRQIAFDSARSSASAEDAGYAAAAAARHALGLNGEPVDDVTALLRDKLGVAAHPPSVSVSRVRMVTGYRRGQGACAILLKSERDAKEWVQRFEYSRALGHLLLDPVRSGALGAASSAFCLGARRRRAGAFAAEFLLPYSGVRGLAGATINGAADAATFRKILGTYRIGATAAARHLWNRRLLPSESLRDELIEEHAAQFE